MPDDVYDERVAALTAQMEEAGANVFAPDVLRPTVDLLIELAGSGGRALEFGVGTGRVAIPLGEQGITVHGIDLSPAMLAQLRSKPAGGVVAVTLGDIATTRVDGTFDLVYAVWNTFMNLTTQEAQVACCRNAAAHLRPGGLFVVELEAPAIQGLLPGETFRPFRVLPSSVGIDEFDVVTQLITSHHYWSEEGRFELWSSPCRYVWPSELDLMAQLAGMTLRDRWGGWQREPFTSTSKEFVCVYEKAQSAAGLVPAAGHVDNTAPVTT